VNTYLQFQGVQCLERSANFEPDGAQVFALTVLVLMASVSLVGTLVHLFDVRSYLVGGATSTGKRRAAAASRGQSDLRLRSSNGRGPAYDQNIALQQQEALLALAPGEPAHCKGAGPVLGPPASHARPQPTSGSRQGRLLTLVNFLMHFSIIRNGRKLFDTSTSRRGRPSAGMGDPAASAARSAQGGGRSLVPGMREPVAVGLVISDASSAGSASSPRGRHSAAGSACSVASEEEPDHHHAHLEGAAKREGNSYPNHHQQQQEPLFQARDQRQEQPQEQQQQQQQQQGNDINCVHGLRFWTISWIVLGHTMQYTEWAGFGRAYQVEQNITSFLLHPLLNATFSVDTFFLISGLLTTYVTWSITRGHYWRFNKFAFLVSRYLRLMPQVLIVMLLFIVFPLMGDGPYWRGIVQKESDNCKRNWWVSALFLQSFYRSDQIVSSIT